MSADRCYCGHETPRPQATESETTVSESLPRVITFGEIREGDYVERESHYCGARFRTDGIAAQEVDGWWNTSEGATVAQRTDDSEPSITLRLLDRPEPPKPALPTTPGVVIACTLDGEPGAVLVRKSSGITKWLGTDGSGDTALVQPDETARITDWTIVYDPTADQPDDSDLCERLEGEAKTYEELDLSTGDWGRGYTAAMHTAAARIRAVLDGSADA